MRSKASSPRRCVAGGKPGSDSNVDRRLLRRYAGGKVESDPTFLPGARGQGKARDWALYASSDCRKAVILLRCILMKATLTLTSRGVVTLPAKLRLALGLKADDQLIAETTPEGLLLRPAVTLPIEIYSEKRIREFDAAEAELAKALSRRRRPKKTAR